MTDPLRPSETDEEPWYMARREGPPTQVSREFSGTLMALCFLGTFLIVAALVAWKAASRG